VSNKKQHRKGSARNFFSPNIAGLRSKTPHTVRFEITVTLRDGILFTATPHKKISDTATPQIPMSPSKSSGAIFSLKHRFLGTQQCNENFFVEIIYRAEITGHGFEIPVNLY